MNPKFCRWTYPVFTFMNNARCWNRPRKRRSRSQVYVGIFIPDALTCVRFVGQLELVLRCLTVKYERCLQNLMNASRSLNSAMFVFHKTSTQSCSAKLLHGAKIKIYYLFIFLFIWFIYYWSWTRQWNLFLDILIKRCPNNTFATSIYRNKTFTGLTK